MRTILLSVCLYHGFAHHVTNSTIFGEEKLLNVNRMFWFALQILSEKFVITRTIQPAIATNVHRPSLTASFILVRFQSNLHFSYRFLKKSPNIKSHKNPSSGSRAVSCGQTDRQEKIIFEFLNFANAPKNVIREILFWGRALKAALTDYQCKL